MTKISKNDKELKKIKNEVLNCKKCQLYKTRNYPVIGEGNHQAKVILVGESPGANEDKTGRPFCGAAGKILDELLETADLKREKVYITNILKDRPPNNRDPQPEEIKACTPYLERQIEIISPEVICPLGNFATRFILKKYDLEEQLKGISKIHGKVFIAKDLFGSVKIIPFYHPAAAVYNINMKEVLKKDFEILRKLKNIK